MNSKEFSDNSIRFCSSAKRAVSLLHLTTQQLLIKTLSTHLHALFHSSIPLHLHLCCTSIMISRTVVSSLCTAAKRLRRLVPSVCNQSRAFISDAKDSTGPLSILFFGTDSFSLPTLALLASSPSLASRISVMCPQDAPSGRGLKSQPCIVKQFALQHSLPVFPRYSI